MHEITDEEVVEKLEKKNFALKVELDQCIKDYRAFGGNARIGVCPEAGRELQQRLDDIDR